jgi:hypothetical protein
VKRKEMYPFIPKSTAYMKEGQFWDIPLSNGQYACGRVLQFDYSTGKRNSKSFLAGLLDWMGETPPSSNAIYGAKLLEQGRAHIKTIEFNKGLIRGFRPLELDNITPLLELSHMPVNDCRLMKGFESLRLATIEEQKTLYIGSSWGLGIISILAESYFVRKEPPNKILPWTQLIEFTDFIKSRG